MRARAGQWLGGTQRGSSPSSGTVADAPWTLAPALAIFMVVLGGNLVVQASGRVGTAAPVEAASGQGA